MEHEGAAFFDEEWDSLTKMFSTENVDFMVHLQGDDIFLNDHENGAPSTFWQAVEANKLINNGTDDFYSNNNLQYFSQESSNSSGNNQNPGGCDEFSHPNYVVNDIIVQSESMEDFFVIDQKNADSSNSDPDDIICSKEELGNAEGQLKRKLEKVLVKDQQTNNNDSIQNPKKKPQKNKKKAEPKSKKNQRISHNSNEEGIEEINGGQNINTQSSASSSSIDDESNASQELNGGNETSESNCKTRAGRGAATDPQSLYARRRRERINERLRILQNLVPNGTKVDISTMLEEAVHYVKFLQLQIKLLSSDDMWMYAPIAYNGMDLNHLQKILPNL